MFVSDIHSLIKKIRGRDSLRKATEKTGISYTYWSILEKGIDPRTKSPIKPSPETLKSISDGYGYSYEKLMEAAGYVESKKESDYSLPESEYDRVIKEAENQYGVNLRDDPVVNATIRELILSLAKQKEENK
jgi:transcriptional regulator with XRE-family HTH domain